MTQFIPSGYQAMVISVKSSFTFGPNRVCYLQWWCLKITDDHHFLAVFL